LGRKPVAFVGSDKNSHRSLILGMLHAVSQSAHRPTVHDG
jgi:hypothetical protein